MRAILVVGNVKEEGIEDIAQRSEVIIVGLARDGLKCCHRCCKGGGDLFWCHGTGCDSGVNEAAAGTQVAAMEAQRRRRQQRWQRCNRGNGDWETVGRNES